ncbi:MAG: galK [Phycisphaerales bacterium]|nr:galK [Phycisphaerales bacterium]
MTTDALKDAFFKIYGGDADPIFVRSPGRVNLIGEHTDYNDGFVFPMAIEPHVILAARARDDDKVIARSTLFPDKPVQFSLTQPITTGKPAWGNYVRGAVAMLKAKGVPLVGMDCLIANTLPPGGGLSSSAAMEVGTSRAMLALAGETMDSLPLALLCQKAEHEFAGVPCGVMDQTIVAAGKAGHAMLLDCRTHTPTYAPLGDDVTVVVVNSMAKHSLADGEYAKRRKECETGVAYFQKVDPKVIALRDVTPAQVNAAEKALGDLTFRRCRHVVTENERCLAFAEKLKAGDYTAAGELMYASHASLKDDYEVSVKELDFLVDTARTLDGVYGSRMTGGGFCGCTVSLVKPAAVEKFMADIANIFQAKFGKDPVRFATKATDGAGVIGT